jgi:hypothetical protein
VLSTLSRHGMLGWTQEVTDFAVSVQPVQPVQPKIEIGRLRGYLVPYRLMQRHMALQHSYKKDLTKRADTLDSLDGANNDGHFRRPPSG